MSDNTIRSKRPYDFLETYLASAEARERSPYTIRNYSRVIERFLAAPTTPGDLNLWDDATVIRWLKRLKDEGVSEGGRAYHQRHLYPFLRWLRKRRVLSEDITSLVPITQPAEVERRVLSPQAFVRLITVQGHQVRLENGEFVEDQYRLRGLAMLQVLRDTGIRRSEIIQLDLSDLDLRERTLRLRSATTKTKKFREVYFTSGTRMALAEYISGQRGSDPGPLFQCLDGSRLTVHGAVSWLRRLAERAGVEASFHDFRRYAASQWIRDGMPVDNVQTMLGHTTPAMSLVYAESGRQDAAEAAYRRLYG